LTIPEPGPRLETDELERIAALPTKPAEVTLVGPTITLLPVDPARHAGDLHRLTNGQELEFAGRRIPSYDSEAVVWRFLFGGPFVEARDLAGYLTDQAEGPDRRCFVVWHNRAELPVGIYSLASNAPAHLRIELGGICLSPAVQGTAALDESTFLALRHCFDLGYRRVEWKCNDRNERSKKAALRLGFRPEGVQQQHMIVKGRSRDTAWFRMLHTEWPGVRVELAQRIGWSG